VELSGAFYQWNINFLKATHDWEMDHFTSLFILVYSIRVRRGDDRFCLDSLTREGCLMLDLTIRFLFSLEEYLAE
jgi:hypothetical protein